MYMETRSIVISNWSMVANAISLLEAMTIKLSRILNLRHTWIDTVSQIFKKTTKNYLITYPSIFLALGGMVQESRIPLEPTASPSRLTGEPGTGEEKRREETFSLITTFVHHNLTLYSIRVVWQIVLLILRACVCLCECVLGWTDE